MCLMLCFCLGVRSVGLVFRVGGFNDLLVCIVGLLW